MVSACLELEMKKKIEVCFSATLLHMYQPRTQALFSERKVKRLGMRAIFLPPGAYN